MPVAYVHSFFPQSPGNQQVQPYHSHLLPACRKDPERKAREGNPDAVGQPEQHQGSVQVGSEGSAFPRLGISLWKSTPSLPVGARASRGMAPWEATPARPQLVSWAVGLAGGTGWRSSVQPSFAAPWHQTLPVQRGRVSSSVRFPPGEYGSLLVLPQGLQQGRDPAGRLMKRPGGRFASGLMQLPDLQNELWGCWTHGLV